MDRKLLVLYSFVDSEEKTWSLMLRQALNKAAFIFAAVTYKYRSKNKGLLSFFHDNYKPRFFA